MISRRFCAKKIVEKQKEKKTVDIIKIRNFFFCFKISYKKKTKHDDTPIIIPMIAELQLLIIILGIKNNNGIMINFDFDKKKIKKDNSVIIFI